MSLIGRVPGSTEPFLSIGPAWVAKGQADGRLGAGAHGREMLECWWLKEVAEKVLWRAPEGRGFSPALEFPHLRAPKGRPIPAQVNEAVKKSSISGLAHTFR